MAVVHTECLCPMDSPVQALAKISNNLSSVFFLMSAGQFRGQTVNLASCLCSEPQILAAINNNISGFFQWLVANGGVPSNDKAGVASLSLNDTSKAVVFSAAFSVAPVIVAILLPPDNSQPVITVDVDNSTVSTTGFTALFGASIPSAGYKLAWIATPAA